MEPLSPLRYCTHSPFFPSVFPFPFHLSPFLLFPTPLYSFALLPSFLFLSILSQFPLQPFVFEILSHIQFGEDASSQSQDENLSCRHHILLPWDFFTPSLARCAWTRMGGRKPRSWLKCMTSQSFTWGPGWTGGKWGEWGLGVDYGGSSCRVLSSCSSRPWPTWYRPSETNRSAVDTAMFYSEWVMWSEPCVGIIVVCDWQPHGCDVRMNNNVLTAYTADSVRHYHYVSA